MSCLFLFLCGFRHPPELTTAPRAPRACLCPPHPAPQRNRLTVQLEEVEGQLREAKRDRKETERDRRVNEAIAALKTQHKGRECAACRLLPAVYCAAALRPTQPMLPLVHRCCSPIAGSLLLPPPPLQACTGAWRTWPTSATRSACWR